VADGHHPAPGGRQLGLLRGGPRRVLLQGRGRASETNPSIAFWNGVLGFEVEREFQLSGEFAAGVTGVPGVAISVAMLAGAGHRIELLQYCEPPDRAHLRPRPCDVGSVHLTVNVDDLSATVQACALHEWILAGEPHTMPTGPRAGARFAYLHDADGLPLEVIQDAGLGPSQAVNDIR
jgi:lactoylglutathione lyase